VLEELLPRARRELLRIPGVVAVSFRDGRFVVYVESEDVARYVPTAYAGYPVEVRVVGRVSLLW
jgi:hypothetical protein